MIKSSSYSFYHNHKNTLISKGKSIYDDNYFMDEALKETKKSLNEDSIPMGLF